MISWHSCLHPSRSTGNDSGFPSSPRSPVASHTRLLTLPGSTATTSADIGSASRSNSTASHLLTSRKGPPCYGKSLTTKVAQELRSGPNWSGSAGPGRRPGQHARGVYQGKRPEVH